MRRGPREAVLLVLVLGCGGESPTTEQAPPGPEVPLGPCEAEWLIDEECTGFPTNCSLQSIDVWGNVIESSSDRFCDGEIESCTRAEFDDHGNQVRRFDGCGEEPTACRAYLYDDEGRTTELGLDLYLGNPFLGELGCDGVYEECHRRTYVEGELMQVEIDIECDGTAERCTDYEYQGGVEVLRTESDCANGRSLCARADLDPLGRVTSSHLDDGCDETTDRQCFTYTYEGDSERPSRRRTEPICGGTAECEDYEYEERTTLISASDCAAPPRVCVTFEEDEEGLLLGSSMDWGCDGIGELCSTFSYDTDGNLTSKTEDRGCGDSPHRCETRSYDGACRFAAAVRP